MEGSRLWRNCLFFSYQMLGKPCNLKCSALERAPTLQELRAGEAVFVLGVCSRTPVRFRSLEKEKPNVVQENPRGWKRKSECRSPAPEMCVCSRSLQPGKTVLPCCSSILSWKSLISCSMVEGKYLKDLAPLLAEYVVRFGFVAEK